MKRRKPLPAPEREWMTITLGELRRQGVRASRCLPNTVVIVGTRKQIDELIESAKKEVKA